MSKSQTKLGLALSGGGFRASLFHIGVLALLAERDILRSVQVISTVSGGSIIGALYYLHVKKLLERRSDEQIVADDFVKIVKRIENDFLQGVRKNLRVRALGNVAKNLRMLLEPKYSRSDRMAELYDEIFYNGIASELGMGPRIALPDLKIQPHGYPGEFHPRHNNEGRRAKVPILIINATTLNTGHNWQFTAVGMGEWSPEDTGEFDADLHLKWFTYDKPRAEKYRRVPLSVAVAASACVPGVFQPLPLTKLYDNLTPRLVDGGVQDNQGLSSILYESCTDVIVSDASGQMEDKSNPSGMLPFVVLRSNSIFQNRVRDLGFGMLKCRVPEDRRMILHLKEGLQPTGLEPDGTFDEEAIRQLRKLPSGIDERVQKMLSSVRTDLDSFTDVEAYSLMYSGYGQAAARLEKAALGQAGVQSPLPDGDWRFLGVREFASVSPETGDYLTQLKAAQGLVYKPFFLVPYGIPLLGILILASTAAFIWVSVCLCTFVFGYLPVLEYDFLEVALEMSTAGIVVLLLLAITVPFVCWFNIFMINPWFLRIGRVERLKRTSRGE